MTDDPSSRPPLVLHSGPVRLALAASTPVVLTALGVYGLTQRVWALTIGLTVVGLVTAVVVLADVPLRSEFDDRGITRVSVLRRQFLPWSQVVAIERVVTQRALGRRHDGPREAKPAQGLVARTGPRRVVLLVDRRESFVEYDELRTLLAGHATMLRASPPPMGAAPAGRGDRALHRRPQRD